MSNVIEASLDAKDGKFVLVVSRFNRFIVDHLEQGAVDCLLRHGANDQDIAIVRVPGAFEMPLAAQKLAKTGSYDAIIAIGAVIRGATAHFEFVSSEATKGLAQVSMNEDIPVTFGLLTVNSIEQAIERAGSKAGNKGEEAAISAIEMVNLLKTIK